MQLRLTPPGESLEQRLAQVKPKDGAEGPEHIARANALAQDAGRKKIQQSDDLAARRRNAAIDPILKIDKKLQERRAKVKSKHEDRMKGRAARGSHTSHVRRESQESVT